MDKELSKALKILRKGGTILYPTDTVWGIGCDATNLGAIEQIYQIKKRKEKLPLIILVSSLTMLRKYVSIIPDSVIKFLEKTKKPTTIIYPRPKNLPQNLLAEDGSIGVRIVHYLMTQMLIDKFGKPIISTSANISGEPTPTTFDNISKTIIAEMDFIFNKKYGMQTTTPSDIYKINGETLVKIR